MFCGIYVTLPHNHSFPSLSQEPAEPNQSDFTGVLDSFISNLIL